MALTLVTITATFTGADGTPANGVLTATLTGAIKNATTEIDPTPIRGEAVDGALVAKGGGPFKLYATDDIGTTPAGAHYQFTVELDNAPSRAFYAAVPHAVTPVDLTALEP